MPDTKHTNPSNPAAASSSSTSISGGAPSAPANAAPANQDQSVSSSVGSDDLGAQDPSVARAIQLLKNEIDELDEKKRKMGEREGARDIATLWKGILDAHRLMDLVKQHKQDYINKLQDPKVSSEDKMDLCKKINGDAEFKQLVQQGKKELYNKLENSGFLGKVAMPYAGALAEGLDAVGAVGSGKFFYDVGKSLASGAQGLYQRIKGESGEPTPPKLDDPNSADNNTSSSSIPSSKSP